MPSNLSTLLNNRHSVRKFLSKPVDNEQLASLFANAQQSPSNCNVQPWQCYVVSGNKKDELKKNLMEDLLAGAQPEPEFDWIPRYEDEHRERQFGSANALYSAMNIERGDKKARMLAMGRNWQFFDAPHVVFFCMKKYLGIMGAVDMGIYAQTLSLLMEEAGIQSCMQGALGQFPKPVKQQLNIPDDMGILFGMSFGYADDESPINEARTTRESIEKSVIFC